MRKGSFLIISLISALLLTSLLNFKPNIQTAKAESNFSDNFDDGVANGWTAQEGAWRVTNGEYFISVGVVENGISIVDGLSLTDCTLETTLRFSDAVGFRAGIVFRYIDNLHYYAFELSNEYDTCVIIKYTPGDYGFTSASIIAGWAGGDGTFPIQKGGY